MPKYAQKQLCPTEYQNDKLLCLLDRPGNWVYVVHGIHDHLREKHNPRPHTLTDNRTSQYNAGSI
jgi:hypothetical protein